MLFDRIFYPAKKKQQLLNEKEGLLQEKETIIDGKQNFLNVVLDKSTNIQDESLKLQNENAKVQRGTMEVAYKNLEHGQKLTELVYENEKKNNILLERENNIKINEKEIEESINQIRKDEINIVSLKSDLRRKEQLVEQKDKELDEERINIKEREIESDKIKNESEEEKKKFQQLQKELEIEKENINLLEEEMNRRNKDSEKKNAEANAIFEKASKIDEEIKAKELKFEEHREKIETSLKEKIEEYDRKIEDLNNVRGIVDDIKYDESEEGKEAKIVVKEAIRQAKKSLNDILAQFEGLDEKYVSGTFKGFSTPLIEIDKCFEELKSQHEQIKAHIENNDLPPVISKWLEKIEEYILKAGTNRKSWEFSEAFRFMIYGLATCKNYELLLTILNEWQGTNSENSSQTEGEEFRDWYEILDVNPEADIKEIRKQWKKLALQYHPDVAPDDKKEEYNRIMTLINKAYDILKDADKRKQFDEKRNNHKQNNK